MKKPLSGILAVGCCALFFLVGPPRVEADSYERTDHTTGTWSATDRWIPTGAPASEGDVAVFDGGSSFRTMTLDVDPTILGINLRNNWIFNTNSTSHGITLRADSEASPYFYVAAHETGGSNITANLTLRQGVTISLEGGRFLVGTPQVSGRAGRGVLTVENGATLNIGIDAEDGRSQWLVAQHSNTRASGDVSTSSVTAQTGSSVSAWLTELRVGGNNSASYGAGTNPFQISGTVDLSAATVNVFDVRDDVVIGRGANHIRGSHGEVLLPELKGKIGGNLLVGDTPEDSSGKLTLNGTHLEIGGDVTIDLTGRVKVTLSDGAAGLKLSATSTLTINALGASADDPAAGYFIDFTNVTLSEDGPLYGLAWEGDHLDFLSGLVGSAITWTDAPGGPTAGLFYDAGSDLTYIGYAAVPEPGTVSLLVGGVALFGWLGRRRLKETRA